MANKLINELDHRTSDASTNLLALFQDSDDTTRKILWSEFAAWQATYMIANSLISAGGGDFYKNGATKATGTFVWNLTPDTGSQITNNADPSSARLKLTDDTNNLVGYTTNVSDDIAGTYVTTDKSFSIYSKVGATVFKMLRITGKNWYMPVANASAEIRVPRVFIQATEPDAALSEVGDIWIWGE